MRKIFVNSQKLNRDEYVGQEKMLSNKFICQTVFSASEQVMIPKAHIYSTMGCHRKY